MKSFKIRFALCLLSFSAFAARANAVYYTATLLRPADNYSIARGVAGTSQVGEGTDPAWGDNQHALLWSGTAASAIDLNPATYTASWANGVSGASQVGAGYIGNDYHALLWSGTAASAVDLNPAGFTYSEATAVSGTKQVGSGYNGTATHALLWTGTAASKVDLNPSGYVSSVATGVSGTKQVGTAYRADNTYHAILWTGTAASRVVLTPSGYDYSVANGVSGTKQVGSAASSTLTNYHSHAMLWTGTAASRVDLHSTTFSNTEARGVSTAGQVGFGNSEEGQGSLHALYWNGTAASMVDLHPFLSGLPAAFEFSDAYGISDDGTIVGFASNDIDFGESYAVMWTPVVESGVPGDYNNDGTVNAADYVVWRKKSGATYPLINEVAATTPGQVTPEDYTAWRARFSNTAGSGSGALTGAIPEPSTTILLVVAGLVAFSFRSSIATARSQSRKG